LNDRKPSYARCYPQRKRSGIDVLDIHWLLVVA